MISSVGFSSRRTRGSATSSAPFGGQGVPWCFECSQNLRRVSQKVIYAIFWNQWTRQFEVIHGFLQWDLETHEKRLNIAVDIDIERDHVSILQAQPAWIILVIQTWFTRPEPHTQTSDNLFKAPASSFICWVRHLLHSCSHVCKQSIPSQASSDNKIAGSGFGGVC